MCGITGYVNTSGKRIESSGQIIRMLEAQKHRGPDDSGICCFHLGDKSFEELPTSEPVEISPKFNGMLGFNRLSILDLSEKGHQPMISPDSSVILTMNGEIYNAFDFKPELEKKGYQFKSTSDTEIVLALYLYYGFEEMISMLNGMFAMVIVDFNRESIFILRDRFGIKPMYFISNTEMLAFSSELKSFKHLDGFRFELDTERIDEFLLFRNIMEGTLYKEVKALKPGHYLEYKVTGELTEKVFFDVNNYERVSEGSTSFQESLSIFEAGIAKSVESQLMSDVKLGCQLSGGIDSSLVTWYANKTAASNQFESVSIVLNDKRFNEEEYIRQVTEQLGIKSHLFELESNYYLENLKKATWSFEAPINHPNTIGIYLLSQRARNHVTVLLSGEGADEVFGGYSRFYDVCYPFLNKAFLSVIKNGFNDAASLRDYFNPDLRAIMPGTFMKPNLAKGLYKNFNFGKAIASRLSIYKTTKGNSFDRQIKYELKTYLPDLLVRQDKMSMAHSIENRVPFLDNNLVNDSFKIPSRHLVKFKTLKNRNTEKYLLKKSAASVFGNDFAFRDKMGFGIPLRQFFTNPDFKNFLQQNVLTGIKNRGIFNAAMIENWLKNLSTISVHELEALWVMISFEIWATIYFE